MPEVWFIRHGESISNADLPTTHPADSPLTEKGRREARFVASALSARPDLLVVSPYLRARETAEPTLNRFRPIALEEWPVQEFTYLDPSRYLNTTGTDRWPLATAYWERNDPGENEGGGGESFVELVGRIQATVERLHNHSADFIVVFSHGLFLRGILWALLGGIPSPSPKAMARYSHFVRAIRMSNGAILKTTFTGRLVRLEGFETDHLAPDG